MLKPSQIKTCAHCGQPITFAQTTAGKWYPAQLIAVAGGYEIDMAQNGGGILPGKKKFVAFARLHRCVTRADVADELNRVRFFLAECETAAADPAESWWDYGPQIEEAKIKIAQLEAKLAEIAA